MSKAAAPAEAGKKKGKGKLLVILVAVLVLALGGGAAAYFLVVRGAAEQAAKDGGKGGDAHGEHGDDPAHEPAVIALPTFTVNLADANEPRYLRTTLSLVVNDVEKAASLSEGGDHKPAGEPVRIAMARSAILELLTTQTAETLMTADGKTALKKEIAERASKAFRFKVNDVLLSEFVVQ
jgi:flagellar FliL protein